MKVERANRGFRIQIPDDVVRALGLNDGDEVGVVATADGQLALVTEHQQRRAALEHLRSFRGSLPADFKFDRDEANARQ